LQVVQVVLVELQVVVAPVDIELDHWQLMPDQIQSL
jgi:hypothetical protein